VFEFLKKNRCILKETFSQIGIIKKKTLRKPIFILMSCENTFSKEKKIQNPKYSLNLIEGPFGFAISKSAI
jgi:hypothetical protein